MAGPLAGEEMHNLCFLLETVEITEDCLTAGPLSSAIPPLPSVTDRHSPKGTLFVGHRFVPGAPFPSPALDVAGAGGRDGDGGEDGDGLGGTSGKGSAKGGQRTQVSTFFVEVHGQLVFVCVCVEIIPHPWHAYCYSIPVCAHHSRDFSFLLCIFRVSYIPPPYFLALHAVVPE